MRLTRRIGFRGRIPHLRVVGFRCGAGAFGNYGMGRSALSDRRSGAGRLPPLRVLPIGQLSSTPIETDPTGPALEFNWGLVPNVQLHAIFGWGEAIPSNSAVYAPAGIGPSAYGLVDTELGAKIRFIKQTKIRPEIGSFTMWNYRRQSCEGLGRGARVVPPACVGAKRLWATGRPMAARATR